MRGIIWGAGESPPPCCSQGSTLGLAEMAEEVTAAGPHSAGALCRAWSEVFVGREGHGPEESTGEPKQ